MCGDYRKEGSEMMKMEAPKQMPIFSRWTSSFALQLIQCAIEIRWTNPATTCGCLQKIHNKRLPIALTARGHLPRSV